MRIMIPRRKRHAEKEPHQDTVSAAAKANASSNTDEVMVANYGEIEAANAEIAWLKKRLTEAEEDCEKLSRKNIELDTKLFYCSKQAEVVQDLQKEVESYIIGLVQKAADAIEDPQDGDDGKSLAKKRDAAKTLWETFGGDGTALVKACKSLLGDAPLHGLFPEEDCIGTFEKDMSDFEEINWREKHKFGKIANSRFCGPYEFCDYEINEMSAEYLSYQVNLYKLGAMLTAEDTPIGALLAAPEFFLKDFC